MNTKKNILITGGAGFIGSHVVRLLVTKYPAYRIVNLDKLTYAGNTSNLEDIENRSNYTFVQGDISELSFLESIFEKYDIDSVIHLAAESHVDRSITDPLIFIKTNITGTASLLHTAKQFWKNSKVKNLFYHISTDENQIQMICEPLLSYRI